MSGSGATLLCAFQRSRWPKRLRAALAAADRHGGAVAGAS